MNLTYSLFTVDMLFSYIFIITLMIEYLPKLPHCLICSRTRQTHHFHHVHKTLRSIRPNDFKDNRCYVRNKIYISSLNRLYTFIKQVVSSLFLTPYMIFPVTTWFPPNLIIYIFQYLFYWHSSFLNSLKLCSFNWRRLFTNQAKEVCWRH